jgi:ubiquinone/menaquinone biosynthesis C-methylase UbiE
MDDVELWDGVADDYEHHSYEGGCGCYPANRVRAKLVLDYLSSPAEGRLLDAGCGTGYVARQLVKRGWDVTCCDLSERMLECARERMAAEGLEAAFLRCSVLDMGAFEDGFFDAVMMLGVLPYINVVDEVRAYREAHRVLKGGGVFISAQYNIFFDLCCAGSDSTMVFKHIIESKGLPDDVVEESVRAYGSSTKPTATERTMKSENPLSYNEKLLGYGFEQLQLSYYNFHVRADPEDGGPHELRAQLEGRFHDRWQGLFLAKTFLSISRKL